MFNRAEMTRRILARGAGPLCGIYVITHRASGKRYVGQSVDIARRWKEHRNRREDTRLSRAIHKHGRAAFAWEIVELCDAAELDDRERYYISAWGFNSASKHGYNLTCGGDGVTRTPEVVVRHAAAIRHCYQDPEYCAKITAANRRKAGDPEHVAKQAAGVRRCYTDPEYRAKQAAANRRRLADRIIYTLEHMATGRIESGKQYELRERLGLAQPSLSELIHGKRKTTKGYRLAASAFAASTAPEK